MTIRDLIILACAMAWWWFSSSRATVAQDRWQFSEGSWIVEWPGGSFCYDLKLESEPRMVARAK